MPNLINSICIKEKLRLFYLFRETIKRTNPSNAINVSLFVSNAIKSALFAYVIESLSLFNYFLTFAFFLNCCYLQIVNIKPINFMVASNRVIFRRKAKFSGLLLGISGRFNRIFLCFLVSNCFLSCLLSIASLLISLIEVCFCTFCKFLSSLAFCFYLTSLVFLIKFWELVSFIIINKLLIFYCCNICSFSNSRIIHKLNLFRYMNSF